MSEKIKLWEVKVKNQDGDVIFRKRYKRLQIIDLRDNPGGHLNQATKLLSLFLSKDKILYQLETKGVKEPIYSKKKEKRNYNVAVLINSNSASASEIVAACFKESYNLVRNCSLLYVGVTTAKLFIL